ncbi:MAG: hypothetical protein M1834_007150 [Cirrosporium novae-zelandiae]|nr:MAG: hypothetical protein M1834_007150 [Cirrosporium novae-zelandiae]
MYRHSVLLDEHVMLVVQEKRDVCRLAEVSPGVIPRCATLNLRCTFDRPVKARGPRKRSAATLADNHGHSSSSHDQTSALPRLRDYISLHPILRNDEVSRYPTLNKAMKRAANNNSPGQHAMSTEPMSAGTPESQHFSYPSGSTLDSHSDRFTPRYSSDRLCPRPLIDRMLNDYLELLYPMVPVVHRPSFRQDLTRYRDSYDADFLSLIIALCAALVATIPRKFQEYRTCSTPLRFQTRTAMVHFCCDMIVHARSPSYFDEISFNKWSVSFLLYLACFQIGQHNRSRMLEVEAMQLARLLDLHHISSYDGLNCIEVQLRKKAFWLTFYGYVHAQLQNLRKEKLNFLDATILQTIKLHELMPIEVDDEYIHEGRILPQPETQLSLTIGFNINSRVFWASISSAYPSPERESLAGVEEYCSFTGLSQHNHRLVDLKERLHNVKYVIDQIPEPFRQWKVTRNGESSSVGIDAGIDDGVGTDVVGAGISRSGRRDVRRGGINCRGVGCGDPDCTSCYDIDADISASINTDIGADVGADTNAGINTSVSRGSRRSVRRGGINCHGTGCGDPHCTSCYDIDVGISSLDLMCARATIPSPKVLEAQFESMRINIHVTHLWLQSVLFEQVNTLESAVDPDGAPLTNTPSTAITTTSSASQSEEKIQALWNEREDICRQLLHILHDAPHVYLEPNGNHLTHKIRDVAATLLACPYGPDSKEARRANEYMRAFAGVLSRLDGSETLNTINLKSWVDKDRV